MEPQWGGGVGTGHGHRIFSGVALGSAREQGLLLPEVKLPGPWGWSPGKGTPGANAVVTGGPAVSPLPQAPLLLPQVV